MAVERSEKFRHPGQSSSPVGVFLHFVRHLVRWKILSTSLKNRGHVRPPFAAFQILLSPRCARELADRDEQLPVRGRVSRLFRASPLHLRPLCPTFGLFFPHSAPDPSSAWLRMRIACTSVCLAAARVTPRGRGTAGGRESVALEGSLKGQRSRAALPDSSSCVVPSAIRRLGGFKFPAIPKMLMRPTSSRPTSFLLPSLGQE